MSTLIELRKTIADFFEVPEEDIGPSFSLRSRPESIARAALDAAIRHRVGRVSRSIYAATTCGEIESELFPSDNVPSSVSAKSNGVRLARSESPYQVGSTSSGVVSCGIDIELVENIPSVDDHWEAPFYRANFSPAEIAYCLRQEMPAIHFAARWCVKEALKKCDPAFLTEEMNRIELVSDDSRAPYLLHNVNGTARRLSHAVSLAHTSHAAVAVVIKVGALPAPSAALSVPPPPMQAPIATLPLRPTRKLLFASILLSLAALGLAALALWRSF